MIFSLSIFFYSCEKSTKIPEDTLVKVYADIVIAQDTSTSAAKDFEEVNKEVFVKYNVSASDYKESIETLNSDPQRWEAFFNKVIIYAEGLRDEATKEAMRKNPENN